MSPLARLTIGVVVLAITLALVMPYVRMFVHVAFLPLLVLLLLVYVGRLLWWYTGL
jgi:hypothetical protein